MAAGVCKNCLYLLEMSISAESPLPPCQQGHFFEDPTGLQGEKPEIDTAPMKKSPQSAAPKRKKRKASVLLKTEDVVSEEASRILGLADTNEHRSGVGQRTSFSQLGFDGVKDRPDGWHFPKDKSQPAIILEFKNSNINIESDTCIAELTKNIEIARRKYPKVIGVLYNGKDVLVFKDDQKVDTGNKLFAKEYYLKLYNQNNIDKNLIYGLTKDINNNLHNQFGMKNLAHRMVFTACALVAKRYGAVISKGISWSTLQEAIRSKLKDSYEEAIRQNAKLDIILECFAGIKSNFTENQEAIDQFIQTVEAISENINSDYWNGEDVMGIFFNEFTRYKGKSEQGQVFTPEHIASLMYRITETSHTDKVLDACCGSGMFLVKAMSNMIREVGGVANERAVKTIKESRLFGVEFDKEMFALACANMLIHKDGKTNLDQNDARTPAVGAWIKTKGITKVLMNPPYERKYGCIEIIVNVLDNVSEGAICAFILPDTKLEIHRKRTEEILKKHSLLKIVKLPNIFAGMAANETSIFIFKAGKPQNGKQIFGCWIKEDGLETVKNQGRHDTKNKWPSLENYWVEVIHKQSGDDSIQWIDPKNCLFYKSPEAEFVLSENDFRRTIFSYILFTLGHDEKEFRTSLFDNLMFGEENEKVTPNLVEYIQTQSAAKRVETRQWKSFPLEQFFILGTGGMCKKEELTTGEIPRISVAGTKNGITGSYADIEVPHYRVFENFVSYSFLGTCFYHPYKASLDMKVHSLKPQNHKLNQYTGLCLVAVCAVHCMKKLKGCLQNNRYGPAEIMPVMSREM